MSKIKQGFTLVELLLVIGIIMILSSVMIMTINPLQRILLARDSQRVSDIKTLDTAMKSYLTINEVSINCDTLAGCPTDFSLTGTDYVSSQLLDGNFVKTIPQPLADAPSVCDYHVYLYPSSANTYLLRWCFESWTENDVTQANLDSKNYCSWDSTNQVGICFTGDVYAIPEL